MAQQCIAQWTFSKGTALADPSEWTDLAPADATALTAPVVVGVASVVVRKATPPRQLVEMLLRSLTIRTFVHVEAEVCLESEQENAAQYVATFRATHTFYTQKKNVQPYRFSVTLDHTSGVVTASPA